MHQVIIKVWSTFSKVVGVGKAHKYLSLIHISLKEYTSLCATIGRNVSFFRNSQQLNGVAEKIDNNGELVGKLEDGTLHLSLIHI